MKKTYKQGAKPRPESETMKELYRRDRNAAKRERRANVTRNAKAV